jgi:hypothetical protein
MRIKVVEGEDGRNSRLEESHEWQLLCTILCFSAIARKLEVEEMSAEFL